MLSKNQRVQALEANEAKERLELYIEGIKNVRRSFLAFGVGGMVLLVSNHENFLKLNNYVHKWTVIVAFGLAVSLQMIISILNAWVNWFIYDSIRMGLSKDKRRPWHRFSDYISHWVFLDVGIDIATFLLLLLAACKGAWALFG